MRPLTANIQEGDPDRLSQLTHGIQRRTPQEKPDSLVVKTPRADAPPKMTLRRNMVVSAREHLFNGLPRDSIGPWA